MSSDGPEQGTLRNMCGDSELLSLDFKYFDLWDDEIPL